MREAPLLRHRAAEGSMIKYSEYYKEMAKDWLHELDQGLNSHAQIAARELSTFFLQQPLRGPRRAENKGLIWSGGCTSRT